LTKYDFVLGFLVGGDTIDQVVLKWGTVIVIYYYEYNKTHNVLPQDACKNLFISQMPSPKEKIRETRLTDSFFLPNRTAVTQATCLLTSKVENFNFEEKSREAQRHDWLLLSPFFNACTWRQSVVYH